jgi:protein-disulfide isomerase
MKIVSQQIPAYSYGTCEVATSPVSMREWEDLKISAGFTQEDKRYLRPAGDYECPYCGAAHPIIKAVQERLGERMCFVFRNFPLVNSHPHAQHAAEAAEAAGAQGRFWEMHDLLFQNQDALEDENIAQYAKALGLDARRLMAEVLAGAHTARVREDFRSGARGGVNGTPTLFINGARYEGPLDATALLESLLEPH